MFPYLRPMDRFLDDCNGSETCDDWNCLNCDNKTRLTDWLTERVGKANWGAEVESREIRSWCQSVCFYMKEVLSGLDNNKIAANNIAVGLEYYTEVEKSGRVDMMLGGYNAKGEQTIIVIELKQWTNGYIEKEQKKGEIFDDPREQVASYCDRLKKQLEEDYREEIKLIPVVYLHNEDEGITLRNETGITEIKKGKVKTGSWNVHVFLADDDSKAEFRQLIEDSLNGTSADKKGIAVFSFLREHSVVFDINDLAEIVASDKTKRVEYIKRLHPDQYNAYTKIEAHIKSGKKHIDIVHGGPGSGKTVIAMLLMSYCREKKKDYALVYKGGAAPNALGAAWEKYNEASDSLPLIHIDKFDKKKKYDMVVFDEFHRYSNDKKKLKDIINSAKTTVLLVDEKQKITANDLKDPDIVKYLDYEKSKNTNLMGKSLKIERNDFYLWTLFRCNQDEGYVTWVEQLLSGSEPDIRFDELTFAPTLIGDENDLNKLYDINDNGDVSDARDKLWTLTVDNREAVAYVLNDEISSENIVFDKSLSGIKVGLLKGIVKDKVKDKSIYKITIGNHYYVQGLERNSVIVILGNEISAEKQGDSYVLKINGKPVSEAEDKTEEQWVQNRYRILLTRGLKKCYIYCMDEGMRKYLKYLEKKEYTPAN